MIILGFLAALILAAIALGASGLMLWSGWLAYRGELQPGFRADPPGPRSITLTLLGVAIPVVLIAIFTLYLAIALVQMGINAL
jgi:hypothetical protein